MLKLEHPSDNYSAADFPIFYFATGSRDSALRRS